MPSTRWLDDYRDDPRIWRHDNRPNYALEFKRRIELLQKLKADPKLLVAVKVHYAHNPVDFILDWLTTYDPRNAGSPIPTDMPFCMFERQIDFCQFLHECVSTDEHGLVEKCRDMGASYVALAYSVWAWLFVPGMAIGVGSRKADDVDKLGNPKAMFWKIRRMIEYTPRIFWPRGFDEKKHLTYMRVENPENNSTISGDSGDNIGRGGRTKMYLKDESAHYERPEDIEAALGDNTNVMIDISSVNGPGNVFHRRRLAGIEWEPGARIASGKTRVFIMDWKHHPAKDQIWYDKRRQKAEDEGLLHKFAQEVDRDYNSAVEGVLIPSAWVQAARDAHTRIDWWGEASGQLIAGQDVADGGGDVNALVVAQGAVVLHTDKDGREVDAAIPNHMMIATLYGVRVYQYEVTGVGTAPKVAARDFERFEAIPWSPSGGVVNPNADDIGGTLPGEPDRMTNRDYFLNANSQAAWSLRMRFQRTYQAITSGEQHDPDDMISIPGDNFELIQELSQPTYEYKNGKIVIQKKPNGAKSPNLFDALKICYAPRQRRVAAFEYGVEVSSAVGIAAATSGVEYVF